MAGIKPRAYVGSRIEIPHQLNDIDIAVKSGFAPVSLGARILRTETAGPVACALVKNILGELR